MPTGAAIRGLENSEERGCVDGVAGSVAGISLQLADAYIWQPGVCRRPGAAAIHALGNANRSRGFGLRAGVENAVIRPSHIGVEARPPGDKRIE